MSLFKSKDWWNVQCGAGETFECSHLCISRGDDVDNDKLIVASVQGYLRIFAPDSKSADGSCDLLLETQLPLPIISVQAGRFANSGGVQVAVLHPKKLVVLQIGAEMSEYIAQYSVNLLYEHTLPKSSYSLIIGLFGQSSCTDERDYLCIFSLDGTLMFYEQERVGIVCSLPDFLLPSPICYIKTKDSFVTSDSAWIVQSYRYQSIVNAALEKPSNKIGKLLADWHFDLSEPVVDIHTACCDQFSYIVILGERNLYCLKDSGLLLWTKKLDYHPICCSIHVPTEYPESLVSVVCTDSSTLLVHKHESLRWNCKLPFAPISIARCTIQSQHGLLAILSESGQLNVLYLGTQTVQYSFPVPHRSFNYENCLREIAQLEMSTRNQAQSDVDAVAVKIELRLNPYLESEYIEGEKDDVDVIRGVLYISGPHSGSLNNTRITFTLCHLITATPSSICCNFNERGEGTIPVQFHIPSNNRHLIIDCLDVEVTVIFMNDNRTSFSKLFHLPLQLAMKLCLPVREAFFKITLSSNQPTVNLTELFADMNPDCKMANAIALEHFDGSNVTILASKSTDKYRLQADNLAALAIPLAELERRLLLHFSDGDFRILVGSPMFTQELWTMVEKRYDAHNNWLNESADVDKAAYQFQIVQRAFHNKALSISSVNISDSFDLVQITYQHLVDCTDRSQHTYQQLVSATNSLECSIRCMLSLAKLASNGKQESLKLLTSALLPIELLDYDKISWEETVDAKLSYLIKKSSSENRQKKTDAPASTDRKFDIAKFRKRLFHAFDMLL